MLNFAMQNLTNIKLKFLMIVILIINIFIHKDITIGDFNK